MKRRWWLPAAAGFALLLSTQSVLAATGFTTQVSPAAQTNATEPSVAIDHSDGTVWVAWQAGNGRNVARSDDGGRTFVQTPVGGLNDIGDVDIRIGGPTPCATPVSPSTTNAGCIPGKHRVYVTSIEEIPLPLQAHLSYSDDRGASWTTNDLAAVNPSFIDRPWLAVDPSTVSANQDLVYIAYHDFTISQIWVAISSDGGQAFVQTDVTAQNAVAFTDSFCNTIPSSIEVDRETHEVYVEWITSDFVSNTTTGCDISQIQNFHKVYVAHSLAGGALWDAHLVFDGGASTNTDKVFATLAVDDSGTPGTSGNVYSVFSDNLIPSVPNEYDIWFTHSGDKASTWSQPTQVNNGGGTNYFPWIAAGSTGRVDFIYLHTADLLPSDATLSPWYTKFAQTTDGTDAVPKFGVTSASSSIMHVGAICTNGIFCTVEGEPFGNRDLADAISIAIDRGGSAGLVWTDQGKMLHGPTHITYGCVTAQMTAIAGANHGLSCKGPAGP